MATRTDYDEPRPIIDPDDNLEELKARRNRPGTESADIDEPDLIDGFEPPGAELLDEELTIPVIPMQANEFRCDRCYLVRHHSQRCGAGHNVCRDCS